MIQPRLSVPTTILLALILLAGCGGAMSGVFGPRLPAPVPGEFVTGEPLAISFVDLNGAPSAYIGRLLRVTGRLATLPFDSCAGRKGPAPRWALVADALQLDATGYDRIVTQLPADTLLTVDGFWRLYEGPVGCGKAPPERAVWYLDVIHIVEPNPLPLVNSPAQQLVPNADATATMPFFPSPTPTSAVPGATPPAGSTPTPPPITTPTPTTSPLASPTTSIVPTATATPRPTNTPRNTAVPSPSNTPPPGASLTPTPMSTETKEVTPTPTNPVPTPLPTPLPTNTPGGYPGPTNTPTPQATATNTPPPYRIDK